jgi:hypothetical protein
LRTFAVVAALLVASCSSSGDGPSTESSGEEPLATVAPANTVNIGLPTSNDPLAEAELVGAISGAIDELDWPAAYEIQADTLWTMKLEPAAADTALGPVDAVQLVEAWNMCAWVLEFADSVSLRDQQRLDTARRALGELDSRFKYTSSGGYLARIGNGTGTEATDLADAFIQANDCRNWPS